MAVFVVSEFRSLEASNRIGVVDVTVRSESVGPGWFDGVSESTSLVTEPKVFPHELQQLKDGQAVCT